MFRGAVAQVRTIRYLAKAHINWLGADGASARTASGLSIRFCPAQNPTEHPSNPFGIKMLGLFGSYSSHYQGSGDISPALLTLTGEQWHQFQHDSHHYQPPSCSNTYILTENIQLPDGVSTFTSSHPKSSSYVSSILNAHNDPTNWDIIHPDLPESGSLLGALHSSYQPVQYPLNSGQADILDELVMNSLLNPVSSSLYPAPEHVTCHVMTYFFHQLPNEPVALYYHQSSSSFMANLYQEGTRYTVLMLSLSAIRQLGLRILPPNARQQSHKAE